MRVLQLGPYPPPYGGVQVNLVAIRRLLLRRGHTCAVANITRHRRAEGDDIYYPESAAQLLRLVRRLRYDILHLHIGGAVPLRLAALAFACATAGRGKSVLTFHSGGYPNSPQGRAARPGSVRGFVFRRFDRIIAVNQQIAEMFARFGVGPSRVRLIAPHATPAPPADAALPPQLRSFFDTHDPVLVTVGLLEPHYDLGLQIDALGGVRERFAGAGLVIVGSGSIEEELRRRIAAKPYAEHVLLCGDVPHDATLRALAEGDIFLRTTHYDGDAISVREALHAGTPVIATDNGMRPAGVHLIPVGDRTALVASVEARLREPRAARDGREGETGEENIAAVLRLYEELLRR
ncbi:MAG: glycosyltransferase family 4 protein [Pyrinomonadaceae bacterium]